MQFLHSAFYFLIILFITSCRDSSSLKNDDQSRQKIIQSSADTDSPDSNFYQFFERFNKDSSFQFQRIVFPLKTTQYNILKDQDSVFYSQQKEFKKIAFQQMGLVNENSEWRQNIVLDSSRKKATVEIRGIDNGAMLDYLSEKRDGKWMLIEVDDRST